MKKVIGLSLLALTVLACKPTKDTKAQSGIKGQWTLTNVTYPKGYKVTSFYIADAKCFEGSQWTFVSNNSTGTIRLNGGGNCPAFEDKIIWTIGKDASFNLKFIGNEKAKKVEEGFRLQIANQTATSFQLVDTSAGMEVVYQFVSAK